MVVVEFGQPARVDSEYERNGTANLFMVFEPLTGCRRVKVTERCTKIDFAHVIRELVDEQYPGADKVVLVMDNLNTHRLSSLYEAFAPEEARLLIGRLEVHHTPRHGSWLNMAETELSVLGGQCLDRRIGGKDELRSEVAAWEQRRNSARCRVDWQFTTPDARVKLKRLYTPTPEDHHRAAALLERFARFGELSDVTRPGSLTLPMWYTPRRRSPTERLAVWPPR